MILIDVLAGSAGWRSTRSRSDRSVARRQVFRGFVSFATSVWPRTLVGNTDRGRRVAVARIAAPRLFPGGLL